MWSETPSVTSIKSNLYATRIICQKIYNLFVVLLPLLHLFPLFCNFNSHTHEYFILHSPTPSHCPKLKALLGIADAAPKECEQ